MENSKETWRPVVGYEDSHLISNLGRVKTIKTNRILVIRDSGVVRFYCGGNKIKRSVKNLVAEAFLGFTPNNKQVVDFIDIENNLNFSIENLKVRNYFYEGRKVGIWTIDKSWSDPETNITKVKAYCPHGESKEMYYSIDRIDNSKGYIKGNIVIATYFENTGRGDAKFKNFNIFCKQLLSE